MITKITKIKNFGIFDSFKWPNGLPAFKRLNLLYGWNWTGKTTLSKIFQCYESGAMDEDFPASEFELELDNGIKLTQRNLEDVLSVRVFNKSFINDNISWEGTTHPIYFVGKENIALEKEISELKGKRKIISDELLKLTEKLEGKKKEKEKLAISTAKNIKDNLTTNLNDNYRFYDKTSFSNFIQRNSETLKDPSRLILDFQSFKDHKQSIAKERREGKLSEITMRQIDLPQLLQRTHDMLSKSITSCSIERLAEDWEINNWVKDGLKLHKERDSSVCEFCGSPISKDLITKLEAHFGGEYNNFTQGLETLISEIDSKQLALIIPDSSQLYTDFQNEFVHAKTAVEKAVKAFNEDLGKTITKLSAKKQNPFLKSEPLRTDLSIDKFSQLDAYVSSLNQLIRRHNALTDNFDTEITQNKKILESYFVAEVFSDYQRVSEDISDLDSRVQQKKSEITACDNAIEDRGKRLLDHTIPADTINFLLKMYFGRAEIHLEVAEDGYRIKRHKEIAKNLSEGEKTAIAFSYFITKLSERDFDLCNGIVVIDDPVSSLDSNALFQAFAFIKNHCKRAGQLFILTHNYDFLRQVKNWFKYAGGNLYMITNNCSQGGKRVAEISKIDKLLSDYDSEYHYLFSLLYRYSKQNEQSLEAVYNLPNIARKFVECFLVFKIPKAESLHAKIESLDYNKDKQTRILRFIQTHSHLQNEDGIINFDMGSLIETPKIIKDILDLVEHEDKRHYDALCASLS